MNEVLVTGGTGFIGRRVMNLFQEAGIEAASFSTTDGDFGRPKDLIRHLDGVDTVVHLAWSSVPSSSMDDPVGDVERNMSGTLRMIQTCLKMGVRRFVFMSSGGTVYGTSSELPITEEQPLNPISSYGITKATVESYLLSFHCSGALDPIILRGGNAYGAGINKNIDQGVIGVWLRRIAKREKITMVGNGEIVRDYVYVDDFARAVVRATAKGEGGAVNNVGSGVGYSLLDVLEAVSSVTGTTPEIDRVEPRGFDVPSNVLCSRKAKKDLGWYAEISLEGGIEKTWREISSPGN